MPMRCQNGVALSPGLGTQDRNAYKVSGGDFRISRVRNFRSNAPMRCQNGVVLSHGLGTQDRTCLQGIRTGLQDLTGSTNQIVHAYKVLGRGCRISRVWNTVPTCLRLIRMGLQDLTGSEHQIVNA